MRRRTSAARYTSVLTRSKSSPDKLPRALANDLIAIEESEQGRQRSKKPAACVGHRLGSKKEPRAGSPEASSHKPDVGRAADREGKRLAKQNHDI